MPIYEYQCPICERVEERIQSFEWKDVAVPVCVEDAAIMYAIDSVPAHPQFKGSGFYATDYKKTA